MPILTSFSYCFLTLFFSTPQNLFFQSLFGSICFFKKYPYYRSQIFYSFYSLYMWGWIRVIFLRFLIINSVTFCLWGIDKQKAKKWERRISEKILLICSSLGWWIGALAAIGIFRHKTIKSHFLWKFYMIGFLRILWAVYLLYLLSS